jgi:hypothetical protein
MKKIIFALTILITSIFAQQCADEFSPEKFQEAPSFFGGLVDLTPIGEKKELGFEKKGDTFYKPNSYITYKAYIYPTTNSFWSYKVDESGKIYEVNVSQIESEILGDATLTQMLNDDFEEAWRKWDGDGYEHYMVPEFVRFKYGKKYLSLKVYFWGIDGDSAKVKKSTINYQIIDFTDEVNSYMRCVSEQK